MSLTPEFIFQTVIVRGLQRMRSDYKLVAQLFRNLDQKSIAQISDFIKTNPIDLSINYPRSELKVPAIVILLKAEEEFQAFLGDSMGVEIPDYLSYDGPTDTTQLTGAATVSSSSGNPVRVFGPHFAFTGTRNTLRISDPLWHTDQWLVGTQQVRIIAGTGVGQVREILGNSRDTLMTTVDWLTIPDSTSQFVIVQPADEMVGEPSTLYDRVNTPDFIERRGGLYTLTYTMQVIGPNPEATIYLTSVLKGILTLYRKFLEEQGVINFKMSTTDFTPRSEYVPDFAYVRGINVEFVYPFDVFEPLEEVARSFRLVLEGEPPDNSVSVEPVLSDTSWNITPALSPSQLLLVDQLGFELFTRVLDFNPIPFAGSFSWQGIAPTTDAQRLARLASVVIANVLDGGALQTGYYAWTGGTPADQVNRIAYVVSKFVLDGAPIP